VPINIPNALTMMRILLIPVLVAVFYFPFKNHLLVAAGIFAVAAITDWFDGYLARRLGQMTAFGAFLDPVLRRTDDWFERRHDGVDGRRRRDDEDHAHDDDRLPRHAPQEAAVAGSAVISGPTNTSR